MKILCIGKDFGGWYRFSLFTYDPIARNQPALFHPRVDIPWGECYDNLIPFGYGFAIESYPRRKPRYDQSGFPITAPTAQETTP